MQFGLTLQFDRFHSYFQPYLWLSIFVFPVLLFLAGCGGGASSPLSPSQSQTPAMQPSDPAGGSSSASGSSSQSSDSNNQPTQSNNPPSSPPPPAGPPGVPDGAQTISDIQTLPNWEWCTARLHGHPCASGLGDATSSMTPGQQDPSVSGKSSVFTLGGRTHYSNALWWKSFGANSTPTHFVYDLYFYLEHPGAPEALEFDVNQSMGGTRYTWGSECSYRDTGHWDIWDPEAEAWKTTSVACPQVSANEWHHLTWQIERVNGKVHYISVTLDGHVSTVDKYYNPQRHWHGDNLSVAFQMDGDYRQDPYKVWLDNVSLSAW